MKGNRKEDFKNIRGMVGWIVFIMLGLLYLLTREEISSSLVMGWGILLTFGTAIIIWAVCAYRDKYISREDQGVPKVEKRVENARKKVYEKVPGKDMYEACRKFMVELMISETLLLGFFLGGISLILFINLDDNTIGNIIRGIQKGTDGRLLAQIAFYKLGPYVLIPLLVMVITYLYLFFHTGAVKRLKAVVEQSPYDYEDINMDFMGGTKHLLSEGLFSIGARYVVVCHVKMALVLEIADIYSVKKEIVTEQQDEIMGMKHHIERYYIYIYTTKGNGSFMCMDELSADLIMEQFALRGLFDHGQEEQKIQADIS